MASRADLTPCGTLARTHDPDRFLTALFAPPAHREAIFTLIAFNHELARALDTAAASRGDYATMGGQVRLQWWREVVEGDPKRHEVATPLAALLDTGRPGRETLLGMIDARTTELDGFEDLETWRKALLAGPGGLSHAIAQTLGAPDTTHDMTAAAGAAYAIGKILRHRPTLLALNRHPMPEALMHADDQTQAVTFGRTLLAEAGPLRLARPQRAAILLAALARRDLARAAKAEPQDGPRGLPDRLAVTAAYLYGAR